MLFIRVKLKSQPKNSSRFFTLNGTSLRYAFYGSKILIHSSRPLSGPVHCLGCCSFLLSVWEISRKIQTCRGTRELNWNSLASPGLSSLAPEPRLRTIHGNDKEADGDEIKRSFVKKGSLSSDKLAKNRSFYQGTEDKTFSPRSFSFSGRSGKMRALSFKTGIACLCGTEVKEKFQCESLCRRRLVESEGEASRFSKDGDNYGQLHPKNGPWSGWQPCFIALRLLILAVEESFCTNRQEL